jgi:hypothetical protein
VRGQWAGQRWPFFTSPHYRTGLSGKQISLWFAHTQKRKLENAELRLRAQRRVFGGQIRKSPGERLIWGVLTFGIVAHFTESAKRPRGTPLVG